MSKRLITDRDVLEGRCGARIVLDGATLITPSARDRAMRLGIAIVEDGEAAGAPMSSGAARNALPAAAARGGVPAFVEQPACAATAGRASSAACARCGSAGCSGGCATCGASSPALAGASCAATAAGAGAGAGAASSLESLPDGLYLVRIERGRAVSTLPAAGPGLMPRANSSPALRS